MTKIRGFELVSTYNNQELLPKRETAHAAGYDLKVAENTVIAPGDIVLVPTGVKAYMQPGEVLYLYDRSSNPRKKGLVLINSVGVIDGDYYGNPGNEGHIFAQMKNGTKASNFAYLITKLHALTVLSLQHLSTTTLSLQHLNQFWSGSHSKCTHLKTSL